MMETEPDNPSTNPSELPEHRTRFARLRHQWDKRLQPGQQATVLAWTSFTVCTFLGLRALTHWIRAGHGTVRWWHDNLARQALSDQHKPSRPLGDARRSVAAVGCFRQRGAAPTTHSGGDRLRRGERDRSSTDWQTAVDIPSKTSMQHEDGTPPSTVVTPRLASSLRVPAAGSRGMRSVAGSTHSALRGSGRVAGGDPLATRHGPARASHR